ncbi:MAG: YdjY domain-containing protein [Verrucomicrobiales bacterium]|nr:YdjY domain-containing protein [Verrucomicrobiales bacterium]
MLKRVLWILPFVVLAGIVSAEGETVEKERPAVTKVGENLYRLGEVALNAKTREIRIPITVNMREGGPIEYVLVHENGKIHESIFTTAVSPLHIQVAMKLLKYKSGNGDVFNRLLAPEVLEKESGTKEDRGDPVSVRFEMEGKDPVPVSETVFDGGVAKPMAEEPWIYTGSAVEEGTFMAEAEGSIIAIYLDHLAMFNMTREGADLDDRWGANDDAIPEIGTKGVLVLSPGGKSVTK